MHTRTRTHACRIAREGGPRTIRFTGREKRDRSSRVGGGGGGGHGRTGLAAVRRGGRRFIVYRLVDTRINVHVFTRSVFILRTQYNDNNTRRVRRARVYRHRSTTTEHRRGRRRRQRRRNNAGRPPF